MRHELLRLNKFLGGAMRLLIFCEIDFPEFDEKGGATSGLEGCGLKFALPGGVLGIRNDSIEVSAIIKQCQTSGHLTG